MNYRAYHVHTELSLLDSTTNFKDYIHRAKELGQESICFTEHGNTYNWIEKKMYCESTQYKVTSSKLDKPIFAVKKQLDKLKEKYEDAVIEELKPIKFLYGVEMYLTETFEENIRDNYHTILIAKNYEGFKEINTLIDRSTRQDHMHYKPRISFDEFLAISNNVIKISACLASPLNELRRKISECEDNERKNRLSMYYDRLIFAYDYYEVQPHANSEEQKEYNKYLYNLSKTTKIPLIAGTDTHSIDKYKSECRTMLQYAKGITFSNEDEFDLTYRTIDSLINEFKLQGVLSEEVYLDAINNTNVMSDSVENFELDTSFKYPVLYDNEEEVFIERIQRMKQEKIDRGEIENNPQYQVNIDEELMVFKEIGMIGFMLFMSELCCWCHDNDIPTGFCRGSVGGSTIAYITDIIDVDPIKWKTVFSRFANKDRKEIGDIDLDFAPDDREKVYRHIIDTFTEDYTAYILTTGTIQDKGTIDEIVRGFHTRWCLERGINPKKAKAEDVGSPYTVKYAKEIKDSFIENPEKTREKYKDIFYYFEGMNGVVISRGIHPAGIVVSPLTLPDNYGTFWSEGNRVLSINMEEIHEINLVKYDILGLKNIGIIKDVYKMIGKKYPKAYEINWSDENVWKDMITSPIGIFQFESSFAYDLLKRFEPKIVTHMSIVNAALRPSGTSYRDRLISGEKNINPSPIIDELLADNNGYLVFQEDTIKFLTDICGLSGSDADNIRRAIGRKQKDRLEQAMPDILEGYCSKSDKPREIAEEEAKVFLQIIEDSSSYQFGFNHSTGYSMIGYLCAYLRYYYPSEFVASYINNASNPDDVNDGTLLAKQKNVKIRPVKFRHSKAEYFVSNGVVYKGIGSIPYMNSKIADEMYELRNMKFNNFLEVLQALKSTTVNSRQLEILIKIDFFSEFGDINKLLYCYKLFEKLNSKNQIAKNKISDYGIEEDILRRFSEEETFNRVEEIDCVKFVISLGYRDDEITELLKDCIKSEKNPQYSTKKVIKKFNATNEQIDKFATKIVYGKFSNIRTNDLIEYLAKNADIPQCSMTEKINYQFENLGYIDYVDPTLDWRYVVVTDLNTTYSPRFGAYSLSNGKTVDMKIHKTKGWKNKDIITSFKDLPLKDCDVIYIKSVKKSPKLNKVNDEWIEMPDSYEWWINDYVKV